MNILRKKTLLPFLPAIILTVLFCVSFNRYALASNDFIDNSSISGKETTHADNNAGGIGERHEVIFAQNTPGTKEGNNDDTNKTAKEEDGKEKAGLKPLVIKGKKKKDIQTISRQTMTAEEIKNTPASFGDSISALTSLPGIMRTSGGIFGPLVIRGADVIANNYFIDDIPLLDPMHFGGLHSIINTNFIRDVDLYSSAFPAEFGSATAAIINFTTIDNVNIFGGYANIGLLSADALVKAPILKSNINGLTVGRPSVIESDEEIENKGYIIGSARYGYIYLGIKAAELITGENSDFAPEYWDYQIKTKYKFNNVHSMTMLLFGYRDFMRLLLKDDYLEEGDDPLLANMKFRYERMTHSQGLYFDSNFSKDFSNRLIYFSSIPDVHSYINLPAEGVAPWAKDLGIHYKPMIFGLRDKFKIKWMNGYSELRGGPEYTFYYFKAKGKAILPTGIKPYIDFSDPTTFIVENMDETIKNNQYGGYLENKFTYEGLTVLPGVRSEYLERIKTATFDPRLMTSYKFSTKTILSIAGGHYSHFLQTNPFLFNDDPRLSAIGKKGKPDKAWHSSVGIEQEIDLFTVKLEGFNNYFYDMPVAYPHTEPDGTFFQGLCTGEQKAYGFEIMLRMDSREGQNGFYGWLSYTYTISKFKSGLPTTNFYNGIDQGYVGDEFGNRWMASDFDQRHSAKLIAGYRISSHTISGKFQYYSGFPYTPIVDSTDVPDSNGRYIPLAGERNSKYLPPDYKLDLRYEHKTEHSWGYITWYVEMINVFMQSGYEYKWYWNKTYSKGSNPKVKREEGYSFLPNFGVEIKF